MRWLLAALVALVMGAAATLPALAFEGDTILVGGPGGKHDRDPCGGTDAMVGLSYKAGKDLNVVWMTCAAMHGPAADGRPSDQGAWGHYADNNHGARGGSIQCPPPMVVQAIYLTESAVRLVHDFWLLCRDLATGAKFNTDWSLTMGGAGGPSGNANCGDDGYATGILVSYGSMIDALGLICTTYHPAPPAVNTPPPPQPPPDKPRPKPDKPPLKVLNGDDDNAAAGGGQGGGNGNVAAAAGAAAATDTTIYDQPGGSDVDYLAAGDAVTIVTCNADNWCRISKPRQGWVWGGDLDH